MFIENVKWNKEKNFLYKCIKDIKDIKDIKKNDDNSECCACKLKSICGEKRRRDMKKRFSFV